MRGAKPQSRPANRKSRYASTPRLEWFLGMLGFVVIGAGVSFLIHAGLTRDDKPGAVRIDVTDIQVATDAYVVRVTVHNQGEETLSQLHLTAQLSHGSTEVESARTLIDYLPGGSTHEGGFYFQNDPRAYALTIRAEGYMRP